MTKNQERPGISDFSDSPHNGCHDTYGPLLSALFEVPPGGASAFVTSTPKQARIALDKSGPTRMAGDLEIKDSPCAKEKRRYGKEWSPSESRNRRNTSLGGGVRLKALPSPSSVSGAYTTNLLLLLIIFISCPVNALAVHRYRSRTMVLEGPSLSVFLPGLSGVLLQHYTREALHYQELEAPETNHMWRPIYWQWTPKAYSQRFLTCGQYIKYHFEPGPPSERRTTDPEDQHKPAGGRRHRPRPSGLYAAGRWCYRLAGGWDI